MKKPVELTPEELAFADETFGPESDESQTKRSKDLTPEELAFANFDDSEMPLSAAQQPQEEQSTLSSYWNAAKKGLVRGTKALGEYYGQALQPTQFEPAEREIGTFYGHQVDKDLAKLKEQKKFTSSTPEEELKLVAELEEKLPSKEGFVEGALERGGKILPGMLSGPGGFASKTLHTAGAALAGEVVKKLGGGEGAQTVAEILALSAPNLHRALVGRNPQQQRLIDFGRAQGLTEEQLVPAVQENGPWRRFLARVANKGATTQDKLESSRNAINDIFEDLRNSPAARQQVPATQVPQVMGDYLQEFNRLPDRLKRQIIPELRTLANSNGTVGDMIQFYQNVNYGTSDPQRIQGFQEVTRRAIESANPQIGEEFRLANRLASNRYNTAHLLRPPAGGDVKQQVKQFGLLYGLVSGDYSLVKAAVAGLGGAKAAELFLLNPRLQNITTKIATAINTGRVELAQRLLKQMQKEYKKDAPEIAEQLDNVDVEELIRSTRKTKQQSEK